MPFQLPDRKYSIDFGELGDKLDQIINLLNASKTREDKMSAQLDALKTQVTTLESKIAATVDKQQEAILLLGRLTAEIQTLKEDPAAINALNVKVTAANVTLDASSAALAAAVTQNTPAPPAP